MSRVKGMPKHLAAYGLDSDEVLESDAFVNGFNRVGPVQFAAGHRQELRAYGRRSDTTNRRRGEGRPLIQQSMRELTSDVKERGRSGSPAKQCTLSV